VHVASLGIGNTGPPAHQVAELIESEAAHVTASIRSSSIEHDPEKWKPVFRKDHAQTKSWSIGST
jgi:hypothetical protein